jgi:hypothetical protein
MDYLQVSFCAEVSRLSQAVQFMTHNAAEQMLAIPAVLQQTVRACVKSTSEIVEAVAETAAAVEAVTVAQAAAATGAVEVVAAEEAEAVAAAVEEATKQRPDCCARFNYEVKASNRE